MAQHTEKNQPTKPSKPAAESLLQRLQQVDTDQFNLKQIEEELMGEKIWVKVLTIPVTMLILLILTFVGAWLSGNIFASFIVSAVLIYFIGKLFEGFESRYKWQARQEVEKRILETEDVEGLIVHFKAFLPTRYRHLVQCLKKGNARHIDQYIQAVNLLQQKLDHQKFTHAWHLAHPETKPEEPDLQNNDPV
ncbi:hypothetical protein JX580_07865 [Thiomicrospira microaerophila]|uniref:hypothetical protein n=1 Tax=Thiomicrospira microaerophila TaxID=406020 RepID=UPI0020100CEF|nr:hypothetical protein [Thiomicrospira microaerophila]UQB41594.1 hypothetical protein JX580_07865 [Thiomicrospira microaerophila]